MRTAKLILCLLVASLAVLSIVEAGTTVFQSAVKRKTAGDRFGAFSVCGAPALFGGNRYAPLLFNPAKNKQKTQKQNKNKNK
jgi:hypothetical protein